MYSTPKKIGKLEIKNRFVRSATYEGLASEEGYVTSRLVDLYRILAEGGVGLIVTGHSYVHPSGHAGPEQMGVWKDEYISGLNKIAATVHKHGNGSKIALQISHCGRQSNFLESTIAPSAVLERLINKMPREMEVEEIEEIVEYFAQAIRRAEKAGFDAVQLHAAHGWLLSEFISPYTNIRTDRYGGTTVKRTKIFEDIYKRSREIISSDFPILVKMNGSDFIKEGLNLNESKRVAKIFSKIGYNAVEISGGIWETLTRSKEELGWKPNFIPESRIRVGFKNKAAYNLPFAKEIKKVIDIPVIVVGGINSIDLVEKILLEGNADFLSFCRPLIRDPDIPNRWLERHGDTLPECIYCNKCLSSISSGGLRCIRKERQEKRNS
jgi:2,4-dienoyl-CoA reductase-like NADH-dependent reductase (Old Yellow Enzyme family)